LATSILQTKNFRILFLIVWWLWAFIHALLLKNAGIQLQTAIIDSSISNVLLGGTVILVAVTLHYYTPQKNRYGYLFYLCIALGTLWLFTTRFVLQLVAGEDEGYRALLSQTLLLRGAFGFLFMTQMALMAILWYTTREQQEVEHRKSEAESLSREAELNNLRQQLQPHFLFNSLNSINALIGSQPQKARTMIQQLSQFLRGTLKKDQQEWITLDEELAHLQLYLDIEKVRFGHRLNTEISNITSNAKLPVMLLQPVVENAIKFGLYDTTEDVTISLSASEADGFLLLQVQNPFDPETSVPQKGTGFGLRSVERRLSLLFARSDLLQTDIQNTTFITTIKIPQP
jgi:two-component system, LytTR family, sensor kinase